MIRNLLFCLHLQLVIRKLVDSTNEGTNLIIIHYLTAA